jgi:hypothetical protein
MASSNFWKTREGVPAMVVAQGTSGQRKDSPTAFALKLLLTAWENAR